MLLSTVIVVPDYNNGGFAEYDTAGNTINDSLAGGLFGPEGIAASGSDLFFITPGLNDPNGTYVGVGTKGEGTKGDGPLIRLLLNPAHCRLA